MHQHIIDLYDSFTHGDINRRDFLDRLATLTGSTAAAAALLPLLKNDYAQAAVVAENDARLAMERVSYDSSKGKINGYLVRPKAKGKRPAVIIFRFARRDRPKPRPSMRCLRVKEYPTNDPVTVVHVVVVA